MNRASDTEDMITTTLEDEAGAWDARLRAPDATDEDRSQFAAWRDADPAHQQAFERMQAIVATLRHERSRADIRALRDEALGVVRHRRRRAWFATAAAAVLVVASGAVLWNAQQQDWFNGHIASLIARVTGTQSYSTSTGQRSTFVLVDGSTIELNAQSRVKVHFSDARRDVQLLEGQALFNVAKDAQRPFVVQAGNRRVLAVGTQFDVRLDGALVQVTLLEGKVRVEENTAANAARASGGAPEVVLAPGQQLVTRLSKAAPADATPSPAATTPAGAGVDLVRDIDVAKVTGWREGRIYFDDLSLEQAVTEMNRHSNLRIRIDSPALAGLRVNGMFKAGEQESFVSALQEYFPISARRDREREIVLVER